MPPKKTKKRRKKINVAKAVVKEAKRQKGERYKGAVIKSAGREDLSRAGKKLPAAKAAKKHADINLSWSNNSLMLGQNEQRDREVVRATGRKLRSVEESLANAKTWVRVGGAAKEGAEQQLARTKKTTGEAKTQLAMKKYAKKKRKAAKKKRKNVEKKNNPHLESTITPKNMNPLVKLGNEMAMEKMDSKNPGDDHGY